jgi:regulator of cell morphogenesis and NO signaling
MTELNETSFKETVDEIVANHHSFLRRELPKVTELMEAITHDIDGEPFAEAKQLFAKVRNKIEAHLKDEESFLFPTGIALETGSQLPECEIDLLERLAEMEKEHDGCGNALTTVSGMIEKLPESDLKVQLLAKIKLVQNDLDVHVEKENSGVHPRFLELFKTKPQKQ